LNLPIHFQEIDYSHLNNQDLIDIYKKNMPPFLLTIIIDYQLQSKIVTQHIRTLILTRRTKFACLFFVTLQMRNGNYE